jgi:hypothetical protein
MEFTLTSSNERIDAFFALLQQYAFPPLRIGSGGSVGATPFAFTYRGARVRGTFEEDGWKVFSMRSELERLGLHLDPSWQISNINSGYKVRVSSGIF